MRRRILADRNMQVLLAGQSVNMLGNTAMLIVLGIWVKDLTGSSGAAGLIFLLLGASAFLSPGTGLLVDRFPRRLVLIVNDLATAASMVLLLLVHDKRDVWLLYVVAGVYGMSGQIYRAARGGLLHSMVPDEWLGDAIGLLSSMSQGLRIVAPLLGAGAYTAFGGRAVALGDMGTFVFSVASYLLLRPPSDLVRPARDEQADDRRSQLWTDLVAGIRHVLKHPDIRRMVLASSVAFAGAGMIDVAMFSLVDQGLHQKTALIGVMTSFEGAGGIFAGLGAGWLMRRFGEYAVASAGFLLIGIAMAISATVTLTGVLAGAALLGLGLPLVLVAELTIVQRRTTAELQGRALSASDAIITTPFTLSIAVGAVIIGAVGYQIIYIGVAAGFVAVALALLPFLKITMPEKIAAELATGKETAAPAGEVAGPLPAAPS
ncbi:MAG TPA: MFS transporter [Streptosporangiaceae bacterium]|nr:MFS transporter [Streptosporangiaceae bacterium]